MGQKRTGCFTWVLGAVAVMVLFSIINAMINGPTEPTKQAAAPEKTAEELRHEKEVTVATVAAKSIKAALRNPDSFVLESALVMDSGAVCLDYRAQNGFGGMNREQAVVPANTTKLFGTDTQGFKSAWRTHCAGKTRRDVTYLVNQYIKLI